MFKFTIYFVYVIFLIFYLFIYVGGTYVDGGVLYLFVMACTFYQLWTEDNSQESVLSFHHVISGNPPQQNRYNSEPLIDRVIFMVLNLYILIEHLKLVSMLKESMQPHVLVLSWNLSISNQRHEDQKVNIIFAYPMCSVPAWVSWNPISKMQRKRRKTKTTKKRKVIPDE